MAEQWRVIDLCGFEGELRSTRGGVEVCPEEGTPAIIPVAEVAVFLVGMKVNLSAAVLHRGPLLRLEGHSGGWLLLVVWSWSSSSPPPGPGGGISSSEEECVGASGSRKD